MRGQIFVTVMNTFSGPPCDRHRGRMVDTVPWWGTQAGTWRRGHARLYSPFLLTQRWAACPGAHASRAGEQVPAHCKHGLNITPVTAASSSSLFLFWGFLFVCLFCLFRAALMAYGGSQARGLIRATAEPPEPQKCQIGATSATYTTAHGNTRSLTH